MVCLRVLLLLAALGWATTSHAQNTYDGAGNLNVHLQAMPGQQTPQFGPIQVATPTGQPLPVLLSNQYPAGSTPLTASAAGSTGITTATMTGVAGRKMYVCTYAINSNATAAATAAATLSGIVGGSMSITQFTAPLASGIGVTSGTFTPCVPATGLGVSIALASAAPGSGGTISVNLTGYYQ